MIKNIEKFLKINKIDYICWDHYSETWAAFIMCGKGHKTAKLWGRGGKTLEEAVQNCNANRQELINFHEHRN